MSGVVSSLLDGTMDRVPCAKVAHVKGALTSKRRKSCYSAAARANFYQEIPPKAPLLPSLPQLKALYIQCKFLFRALASVCDMSER